MKKYKGAFYYLIISSLAINVLAIPSSVATTKTKLFKPSKAGRISTVVANTILNGITPPKNSQGIDGDFYIDTKTLLFYGPKTRSHWPPPTSIRGPQGQKGQSGANGVDAKPGANVLAAGAQGLTGATGPKGEQGVQGIQGVAGSVGPKGETGATGPVGTGGMPGSSGAPGSPGPQGPQGSAGPQGPQGSAGPQGAPGVSGPSGAVGPSGPTGATGATGTTGSTGATGTTGATGFAGVSNALYGPVNFSSPIQGVAGSAQTSSNFGTYEAGKSYLVRIQIQTFNVDRLLTAYPLALDIATPGAAPSYSISYLISNGSSFNLSTRRDDVSISAEVIIDGSQVSNSYSLSLTVTCGSNTSSFPITLIGRYQAIMVGQVTQTS